MASLEIQNGIVEKVFFDGKGARVKESFARRDGSEGASYYTAFFDTAPGIKEGDKGRFWGLHSVKLEEYEGKTAYKVTLNSARFTPAEDDGF